VPPQRPLLAAARRAGLPIIAEVELAFPFLDGPVVGITGSNGKSTTTALTGALLRAAGLPVEVCGNIGRPLSAVVEGPPGRVFVVELSSFQLEATETFRPRAAALLNLSPDHLDRYPDLAGYGGAKQRIFRLQGPEDTAVLNADDPWVADLAVRARRRRFSLRGPVDDGAWLDGERVVEGGPPPDAAPVELFRRGELPLAGVHNLENAMAAALLARAMGVEPAALRAGLASFHGLPHRLERVAEEGGVVWYDDSKGTNVAATARAVEGFPDRSVHLILGGRNKGADPADLRPTVERKAARLYLIGESAADFERALGDLAPVERAGTLAEAVRRARRSARPGEAVVLSPACASFDQFRDFADRGRQFQALVREAVGGAA
jgi:UDP-N-acetylmuramoylalanine--D-glutamate ligase